MRRLARHFKETWQRLAVLHQDAQGFVMMSTLAIFLFLFVFCSSIYAIGETIHQRIKLQNACDAAAYSAAVVQADGLSRMACINRAMSWTYVQMTNRQMDYITYRWLKLTCKQFDEDKQNAQEFAACLVIPLDKEFTWVGMIIEAIAAYGISAIASAFGFDVVCAGSGGTHGGKGGKASEGLAWWCGRDGGTAHGLSYEIELNNKPPDFDLFLAESFEKAKKELVQLFFTREHIGTVLNTLSYVFGDDGEILGTLIDYDKLNIQMLNGALGMVNQMMGVSMKVTAENVLKSSLKDRRLENDHILSDYHISIQIPQGVNPYDLENPLDPPKSYFSPLRNTEADEMLFLNMQSPDKDKAKKALPGHFPVALGAGDGKKAYGLDQWFIRGRGVYENDDESEGLLATERSEGELGIQRAYKDANLNETKAGAFMRKKVSHAGQSKTFGPILSDQEPSKNNYNYNSRFSFIYPQKTAWDLWNEGWIAEKQAKLLQAEKWKKSLPACCQERAHIVEREVPINIPGYFTGSRFGSLGSSWRTFYEYTVEVVVPAHDKITKSHHPVSRGNHIVNLMSLLDTAQAIVANMPKDEKEEDETGDDDLVDLDKMFGGDADFGDIGAAIEQQIGELDGEIADLEARLAENPNDSDLQNSLKEKQEMRDALVEDGGKNAQAGQGYSSKGSHSGGGNQQSKSPDGGLMSKLTSLLTGFFNALVGDILDVQASCGNEPGLEFADYPMCRQARDTYALYSQYRWASGKWYCITSYKAYFLCGIFHHGEIWCDFAKHKVKIAKLFQKKVKGKGHWHIAKWFCAARPRHPLDQDLSKYGIRLPSFLEGIGDHLAKYFIPMPLPKASMNNRSDFSGPQHSYMECTGDLQNLIWPLGQYTGKIKRIERNDFKPCVPFFGVPASVSPAGAAFASTIQGHARIYGDDKRIFDNRYVGAVCKPWVLNERFFAGEGTIVVGAAMRHRNPFVQLFDFLERRHSTDQNMPEHSLYSAFNIPDGNVMWTMAAARAGVRRHRRDGLYDQPRQYQITYDPTSDGENLQYAGSSYYVAPASSSVRGGLLLEKIDAAGKNAWRRDSKNPQALTHADIEGQKLEAVWDGCPCGGENAKAFQQMWNLCEWDWDATLIPLRYAGIHARLKCKKDGQYDGKTFHQLTYSQRLAALKEMRTLDKKNRGDLHAQNDDYLGNGANWYWDYEEMFLADGSWRHDFFIMSPWKKADATFFENLADSLMRQGGAAGAAIGNWAQDLDLNTKIPRDESDNEWQRHSMLLRKNRVL